MCVSLGRSAAPPGVTAASPLLGRRGRPPVHGGRSARHLRGEGGCHPLVRGPTRLLRPDPAGQVTGEVRQPRACWGLSLVVVRWMKGMSGDMSDSVFDVAG